MFQPIPPVTVSPPVAAVPPQGAPVPGGLDVASGPLPQVSAFDASGFGDALRAGAVQDVTRQRAQPGDRVWAGAGRSLGSALGKMSAQEEFIHGMMHDIASPPDAGVHKEASSGPVLAADGTSSDPQSLMQANVQIQEAQAKQFMAQMMAISEFSVTTHLASGALHDGTTSIKQLANGGSG